VRGSPEEEKAKDRRAAASGKGEPRRCVSCGSLHHVHTEPQLPGVWWCDECWEDAHVPDPRDEIGTVD
jgi:hypothetical protein